MLHPRLINYQFDVLMFDGARASKPIGQIKKVAIGPVAQKINTAAGDDVDEVLFDFGGQHWENNDQPHHYTFGPYHSGNGGRRGFGVGVYICIYIPII